MYIEEKILTCQGIHVYQVLPENPDGLMIWYHGWSSRADGQLSRARVYAHAGWQVLIPEMIHHDSRGKIDYDAPESYPYFWQTILQNIRETANWIHYAQEQGHSHIVVNGHSMGGYTALGAAAHYPEIKAAVAINGSGHWPLSHLFMEARFAMRCHLEEHLWQEINAFSPHQARQLPPLLLLHGEIDPSVDPRANQQFAHLMQARGFHIDYESTPLLGHYVTTSMLDRSIDWLANIRKNKGSHQ